MVHPHYRGTTCHWGVSGSTFSWPSPVGSVGSGYMMHWFLMLFSAFSRRSWIVVHSSPSSPLISRAIAPATAGAAKDVPLHLAQPVPAIREGSSSRFLGRRRDMCRELSQAGQHSSNRIAPFQ